MGNWQVATTIVISFLVALGAAAPTFGLMSQFLEDGSVLSVAKAEEGGSGLITFEDMKLGVSVGCKATGMGTVGPGAIGEVSSVLLSPCEIIKGCTTLDAVTAISLPWKAEVVLSSGTFFGRLGEKGKSAPGYLFECVAGGVLIDNLCTKLESFWTLMNNATGVVATASEFEQAKCSLGGEEGLVHGTVSMTLNNGLTLAVSEA